jgi:hypothetical protein
VVLRAFHNHHGLLGGVQRVGTVEASDELVLVEAHRPLPADPRRQVQGVRHVLMVEARVPQLVPVVVGVVVALGADDGDGGSGGACYCDAHSCNGGGNPARNSAPFLTPAGELVGEQVPSDYNGVKVEGSYGPALLVQSDYIPPQYVLVAASYGVNSPLNVVGFREHPNTAYQGLRLIPGHWQNYPIIESFAARGCGVGVRHRGAAVAIKVGTGSYTPPTIAL